jgi:hypothetical protein
MTQPHPSSFPQKETTMSEIQKSSNGGNLMLLGAGILCLLGGFVLMSNGTTFASIFLGARFLFGFPFSDADRLKVLFIEIVGILAVGQGAVVSIVGLFRLARNGAPQGTVARPIGR